MTFLNIKLKHVFGETSDIVSKKTQEMQKNLLHTLHYMSRIYFFFLYLPLLLTFLCILGVIQSLYIGLIAFNLIPIHAILIYICMIANMRPYRNFLLKVAMRTVGMKVAETTSTVVGTNSTVIKGLDKRRKTLETSKNTRQAWN